MVSSPQTHAKSYHDFRRATDAVSFLASHEENVRYWRPINDRSERLFAAVVDGEIWTPDELTQAKFKRKRPAKYNLFRVSSRVIEGTFRDLAVDVAFTPVRDQEDDKELVEGLEGLRIQEANINDDAGKDAKTFLEAWIGPNAWQEVWCETAPGLPAITRCSNRDRFSVYPDPRSRIPITRDDAEFIDVVDWLRPDQLVTALPRDRKKLEDLLASRQDNYDARGTGGSSFEQDPHSRDRAHESEDYRDGRFKVVTRYYRTISQKGEYWDTDKQQWVMVESPEDAPRSSSYRASTKDELWWIVAIPGLSRHEKFANEKYYLQLRHPRTGRIMFPFVELAAEVTNGQISGFVEHELEPVRGFNSMLTNVLHSAKHSSSQAKLIDPTAFVDESEAKSFGKNHSDADRTFKVKPGQINNATKAVEHSTVSNDTYRGMEIAKSAFDEVSSTPPSLQGQREANESGVLYSQRVEQGQMQLRPFVANYIKFLERKYLLRYMMWREFYTQHQLVRLMDPSPEQREEGKESIEMNQPVDPQYKMAQDGTIELVYRLKNDVNAILYDITVKMSKRTPSERMKVLSRLTDLAQSPLAASDPGLASVLFMASAELSDLPQKYQDMLRDGSQVIQQQKQMDEQIKAAEAQQNSEAAQQQAQVQQQAQQIEMAKAQAEAQKLGMEAAEKETDIAQKQLDLEQDSVNNQTDLRLKQLEAQLLKLEVLEKEQALRQGDLQTLGMAESAAVNELGLN